MENKKIFITGCAKTGTTLVRRLFNAFDELEVYNRDEMSLGTFLKSNYNVAKRTYNTIFSNKLSPQQEASQLKTITTSNVFIVNVVRDKSSVLKSDNGYVKEWRYNASMKQAQKYQDYIDFTISYEELIKDPNKVQKELSNKLDLKISHDWSDYPQFMKGIKERAKNSLYSLRPIGAPKK